MSLFLIIIYCNLLTNHLVSLNCLQHNVFDYIVVGSGSSGAIVATRLSEDAKTTVLLLEAGREPLAESYIPFIAPKLLMGEMNWNYTTVPQKNGGQLFKHNMIPIARGKALGGSSSINFMAYTRGNKMDFDTWQRLGNPGWNYSSVYPYFLKLEDYEVPRSRHDDKYHHEGGPITVSLPAYQTPMANAFLQAGFEVGQPLVDYNADHQTGFMFPPANIKDGARCSTYRCYLQPAMKRSNLHVLTNALVTKIIINGTKATGVQYERSSSNCIAKGRKEIIISAGAINSPQLLMLSGIGPKDILQQHNISLVKDVPGVGQNLQDHPVLTGIIYKINQTISYNTLLDESKKYLDIWRKSRTGPMTCPAATEGIAFYQSKYTKAADWPDFEICLNSVNAYQLFKNPVVGDYISFIPFLLRPKSRGFVTLKSKNPYDPPIINPRYLSHPNDIDILVESLKFIRKLADTKAFKQYGASIAINEVENYCNSSLSNTEEFYKCLVKVHLFTAQHPVGTCKMGPRRDSLAVVDSKLRVYGFKNLRVVDASIMPNIISGHTNAACMMIGEKAADMIKQDNN